MILENFQTLYLTCNLNEFKCFLFQSTSRNSFFKYDNKKTIQNKTQNKKYLRIKIKNKCGFLRNKLLNKKPNMLIKKYNSKKKSLPKLILILNVILLNHISAGNLISNLSKKSLTKNNNRPDMLCNVGDEHECVCNRSLGNLDNKYLSCDNFLQEKQLNVVCIKMRNINLNAHLYTNESYQQYFRRRIANILSKYCEHQANECPGTILDIRHKQKLENNRYLKEQLSKNKESGNLIEKNSINNQIIIEEDEEEPAFTTENVVILKVTFHERNRINVYFVVTKNSNVVLLNKEVTMEPNKIKYIMAAQIGPLSRILGGIRIEQIKLVEMRKARAPYSNKTLIITVSIIGISFTFCCFIALLKLLRDNKNRAKNDIRKNSIDKKKKTTRNYGTCTDKFLLNYDELNEKLKSKSTNNSKKSNSTAENIKMSYMNIDINDNINESKERDDFKQRSLRNLFRCDPSQLPEEISLENIIMNETNNNEENDLYKKKNSNLNENCLISQNQFQLKNKNINPPSVVLISSQSDILLAEANNNDKILVNNYENTNNTTLTAQRDFNYERPLSRRSSRESTPEHGAEACGSSREETPLPLGDRLDNNNKIEEKLPTIFFDLSHTKNESWTDEIKKKDDESENYCILQNYSPNIEHLKQNSFNSNKPTINVKSKLFSNSNPDSALSSDSGEDEETKMLDRHQYERLQESPLPPPILNQF